MLKKLLKLLIIQLIFHSFELVNSELDEVKTNNYALFFI